MDGRGRARTGTGDRPADLRLPPGVRRLLRLRGRLSPGLSRGRALSGPHRPSPEMDRGHRIRGQARPRDRQRRDGGDARAGIGQTRRSRRHAAEIADLRRREAVDRRRRRRPARDAAAKAGLSPGAMEKHSARRVFLPILPAQPAKREMAVAEAGAGRARARLRRRERISRRATTRGSSGSASFPTAICSGRSANGAPRSSPIASKRSREAGSR